MSNKRNDISILYMAVSVLAAALLISTVVLGMKTRDVAKEEPEPVYSVGDKVEYSDQTYECVAVVTTEPETAEDIPVEPEPIIDELATELPLTKSEIDLIALVTMAEAEGESEEGKRLVIDTILNRVDDKKWPDTVKEVIYQPNQFSSMWNGRVDRCYVREDICELVRDELRSRTNYEVVYFRTQHYSRYGTPLFQVGNHYFSSN